MFLVYLISRGKFGVLLEGFVMVCGLVLDLFREIYIKDLKIIALRFYVFI